ncbi:hypothetical protein [Chryseolinea lacunae]|uniref:PepSY domain-containing protein n=1 Tax=Chryseolinea lacunae TaxID=2801331 RepID=A0ABS1KU41_9BACT|nr:hypothetical protein [Chryseolinea lacunae]MBL0742979.1 hypothetical protein [Chryseolinea lacunae]
MKLSLLLIAGSLFATTSYAQLASNVKQNEKSPKENSDRMERTHSDDIASEDEAEYSSRTRIKANEAPESLRKTLQGAEYKGWENAHLFRRAGNGGYILEIYTRGEVHSYRFNNAGKMTRHTR